MARHALPADPFLAASGCEVVAAGPNRAVVEQAALAELDNHVGVRHASALHAAGYAASRALVAALEAHGGAPAMRLVRTEIAYTAVGLGPLQTVAEPADPGWGDLGGDGEAELPCTVTTRDEAGKKVAELTITWAVTPRPMGR